MIKKKSSQFHQLYNQDWEKVPIFQGWLSPVKSNKFKAFCKYCKKDFRAHRTDLRTHAHSHKHQKSADAYYENEENLRALKQHPTVKPTQSKTFHREDSQATSRDDEAGYRSKDCLQLTDDDCPDNPDDCDDMLVTSNLHQNLGHEPQQYSTTATKVDIPTTLQCHEDVAQAHLSALEAPQVHQDTTKECDDSTANIISTQVQDMIKGLPIDRLVVYLYLLKNDQWVKLGKGTTEKDGSCSKFISVQQCEDVIVPGHYKLRFETKMYFTLNLEESLFPFIEVPFDVCDITEEHKINLLLSPCAYMVFLGS